MEQPAEQEKFSVPIEHVGLEDTPIIFANQFVLQFQADEFLLAIGQITPPFLFGSKEERLEQIKKVQSVRSNIVARYAFTRARLDELIRLLEEIRDKADAAHANEES